MTLSDLATILLNGAPIHYPLIGLIFLAGLLLVMAIAQTPEDYSARSWKFKVFPERSLASRLALALGAVLVFGAEVALLTRLAFYAAQWHVWADWAFVFLTSLVWLGLLAWLFVPKSVQASFGPSWLVPLLQSQDFWMIALLIQLVFFVVLGLSWRPVKV